MKKLLFLSAILFCLSLPLAAQVSASGSFSTDTVGTTASIVTMPGPGIAGSAVASTSGTLSCSVYPQLSFWVTRNAINYDLADITTSNGSSFPGALKFTQLIGGDVVYAKISRSGSGCSNEFPLTVTLTYMPSGGICYSNPSACVTLSGYLAASNGIASQNLTLTFTPSQVFYVAGVPTGTPGGGPPINGGAGTIINAAINCATSVDGSVVGIGNPLAQTIVSPMFTGTLPSGTYYVEYAFYDFVNHTTLVSPETTVQLTMTGELVVAPPVSGIPQTVAGMMVYIGTTSGAETLQGSTTGTHSFTQSTPLAAGAAVPIANNTICQVVANDAGWPSGTGYNATLADADGNALPGYPMLWQLTGPGTVINLSNGLPYYHGTVIFPQPILAAPLNHATQSISGGLNLGNFNLYAGNIYVSGAVVSTQNYNIVGNLTAGGNGSFGGNLSVTGTGTFGGTLSAPTVAAGSNVTSPAAAIAALTGGTAAFTGLINTTTGYQFNGMAATGACLVGNGTYFIGGQCPGAVVSKYCTGTVGSAETEYLNNGTCSGSTASTVAGKILVPVGGLVGNLQVLSSAGVTGGSSVDVMTVLKNGSSTSLTCTIAPSGTNCSDVSHSFSVAAGDLLTFQFVTAGSDSAANILASVSVY